MTKSKPGRKRLIRLTLSHPSLSLKEVSRSSCRAGPWRQGRYRGMEGAAYWLPPHGLLSLLSYRTQDHQPGDGPTHNGLGPINH